MALLSPEPARAAPVLLFFLARGGMGFVELVVRRGTAPDRFDRFYARKRLHPQYREDPDFRASFMDEARLAGLVRHPNVVTVYDVGEDQDGPYLLMELVDGVPAARLIADSATRGPPLPVQVAARIAMDAARGLHAAHEARAIDGTPLGLVHRDVSPHNILVGFDGSVRVTDFGIARAFGNASRTSTGVLKGNLGYLSPEQLRFEEPDRRSDLFGLGVVLHELLAGERLYGNRQGFDGPRRILHEPPADIVQVRHDVPAALVELSFELLAKDADVRPSSAAEVAERLDGIIAELAAVEGPITIADHMTAFYADERVQREAQRAEALTKPAPRPPAGTRRVLAGAIVAVVVATAVAAAVKFRSSTSGFPITILAAGAWHTCAVRDGRASCWGKNNQGQLGNGATRDETVPVNVFSSRDVIALGLGDFHSCACDVRGVATCWGRNTEGQLGTGDTVSTPTARPVVGVARCRAISAGTGHTCLLSDDGTVWCWGQWAARAVGPKPRQVEGLVEVIDVRAAGGTTCALRRDGQVLCLGGNDLGQLGDGTRQARLDPVLARGVADATQIDVGPNAACALRRSGRVACWGFDPWLRRPGADPSDRPWPADLPGIEGAQRIAVGHDFACVLRPGGVDCWGENRLGQLGRGHLQAGSFAMARVPGSEGFHMLVAGSVHVCGMDSAGVSCWGCNETGQLGDGSHESRPRAISVAGMGR